MKLLRQIWSEVRRGENIDLYATVFIALTMVALSLLGASVSQWIEPLTLSVLALLAIGLLGTRHQISQQLENLAKSTSMGLRGRSELISFRDHGATSSEIIIVGISLISAVIPHLEFFEQSMHRGCKIKFLLLNPDSVGMQMYNLSSKVPNIEHDVKQSLNAIASLKQLEKTTKGRCEVRLSDVFLSVGLSVFDAHRNEGLMNVEIIGYKRHPGNRPNLLLTKVRDQQWYDYFYSQYESIWSDSKPWTPAEL